MTYPTLETIPLRPWLTPRALPVACVGCRDALRNVLEGVYAFCGACLERSRGSTPEELGGEG